MPVAALDSLGLLGLALTHATLGLEAVVDTRSVGDDERRSGVSLSLADGLEALCVVGTHSNLCYVDVAIGCLHEAEVLLLDTLAGSSELSYGCDRSSLGRLATSVGVDLGVDNEDVDILAGSKDMVESAVADIVGSTVAADDPLAPLDEVV